jgi:hypothetical protein
MSPQYYSSATVTLPICKRGNKRTEKSITKRIGVRTGHAERAQARPVIFHELKRLG